MIFSPATVVNPQVIVEAIFVLSPLHSNVLDVGVSSAGRTTLINPPIGTLFARVRLKVKSAVV